MSLCGPRIRLTENKGRGGGEDLTSCAAGLRMKKVVHDMKGLCRIVHDKMRLCGMVHDRMELCRKVYG